jgi:hypothetical protein
MSLRGRRTITQVEKTDEDVKTEEKSLFDELQELSGDRQMCNVLLTNKVFMKYVAILDFIEEKAHIDISTIQPEADTNLIRGKLDLLRTIRQLMVAITQSKGA